MLKDAVAITKTEKGKIRPHQTKDYPASKGFLKGGVIGIVFEVWFGAAGWEALRDRMAAHNFQGETVISEMFEGHLAEVEKLADHAETVEAVPEEVELSAEAE